jgi:hypothetical protein
MVNQHAMLGDVHEVGGTDHGSVTFMHQNGGVVADHGSNVPLRGGKFSNVRPASSAGHHQLAFDLATI